MIASNKVVCTEVGMHVHCAYAPGGCLRQAETQASLPQYMHIVHANAKPGQRGSGVLIRHAFVCS